MTLLSVKDLSVAFGSGAPAVAGISFDLAAGETLGIVGESGSGKSVTALSIMRLLPDNGLIGSGQMIYTPQGGEAIDLAQAAPAAMQRLRGRRLGMIFQEPMTSLNPVFRCGDQVAEVLRTHLRERPAQARERTLAWFERVQLPDPERIYQAYPHQLSGGQKQRVMIAMAMIAEPDLLLADEPTTALDVTVQKTILDLIRHLKAEIGTAVVLISHDLGIMADMADRVLVMRQGHIVEQGTAADIFAQPQHPYTQGLLACRPPLSYRVRRLPTVADFMPAEADAPAPAPDMASLRLPSGHQEERLAKLQQQAPLLKVQDLHTRFPTKQDWLGRTTAHLHAVDGVSLEVYPGETLGLVGESGCGKTTLGRSILRLTEPHSGHISFEGRDVRAMDAHALQAWRREVQIIFQDPYASLNPRLSAGEAILEPMTVHGLHGSAAARREEVASLLHTVGLSPDHYHRYPHEFSGGQRQRIGIARALAVSPRFLICDESVSALDVSVQAQVLNLLMDLREERQLTYIFISHDLSVVKLMSDRIAVMYEGKIVESGPADVVYERPKMPYTQRLIAAIPSGGR